MQIKEENGKCLEVATVLEQVDLGSGYYLLILRSPRIAAATHAGQFLLMSVRRSDDASSDPLLRRPFSILGCGPARGTLELLYRVVGTGTRLMPRLEVGEEVSLVGPLGNGWPGTEGDVVLVAGGVGMPPLLYLAEELSGDGRAMTLFYGACSVSHLHLLDRFEQAGVDVRLATDDGSAGHHGSCVHALEKWLDKRGVQGASFFGCGPHGMLAAFAKLTEQRGLRAFVSLEAPMACGIGVCRGCAVPMRDGTYRMVCSDGPIFTTDEVSFE